MRRLPPATHSVRRPRRRAVEIQQAQVVIIQA
jgi:hypothetical protein